MNGLRENVEEIWFLTFRMGRSCRFSFDPSLGNEEKRVGSGHQ